MKLLSTISPDNVSQSSLAEILTSEESQEDLEFIKDRVKAALFSNYPERRVLARKDIKKYWGKNTDIASLEEGNITYAYLHFKTVDVYVLVGRYRSTDPVFEEVPDHKERARWRELQRY